MSIKRLTITIEGVDDGDLELALDEVKGKVTKGCYTSGFDNNETSAFHFDITEEDEPSLAWTPPDPEPEGQDEEIEAVK